MGLILLSDGGFSDKCILFIGIMAEKWDFIHVRLHCWGEF